ncbi:MAG TPA: 3-isopropylmalate dehydrogenase [Burkholderiales bacterium]|nr:3-isopropylmalate dehydrogenase [Burkholderiales bacterium]
MKIAVLPGDGIGKEVTAQAVRVLKAVVGGDATFTEAPIGGEGVKAAGVPLPPETFELAKQADAILFGAAGLPGDELGPRHLRSGLGLLTLRRELKLYANFRPAVMFPELVAASSLKPELVEGLDLMVLRELNGDIYYGTPRGISDNPAGYREGVNTMRYTEPEIERIAHVGFKAARGRRKKLCSVDKANVLETMVLWRETVARVGKEYPDVELRHLYVDAASMELLRAPKQFDLILAPNMFGDILSDAAAMLTGSIGMLPSASIGDGDKGLYEPVHGSAPDIAGRDIANPLAAILSAAMLLRHSFGRVEEAERIERAVRSVLAAGCRTADIMQPGKEKVGTAAMGGAVIAALR